MTLHKGIQAGSDGQVDDDRIGQLYAILRVVEQMEGVQPARSAPDESRLSQAYAATSGIARSACTELADDIAAAASAGARALLGKHDGIAAAAGILADHLRSRIAQLGELAGA